MRLLAGHCRNCGGDGYVIDKMIVAMSFGMFGILGWLTSDGNPRREIHKQVCGRCGGSGEEP